MFLNSRELLGDSNKALNIVFYVVVAVLFALLCTVAILHCILLRQQRQYVQSSPRSMVILHISHTESYVEEKINDDDTVTVPSISKYTSSPKESKESECPFRFSNLSPSNLEKASDNESDNDISNRPTIARPLPSYTPAGQSIKLTNA